MASPPPEQQQLWLHAMTDPLTNLRTTTNLMRYADINSDGDFCLVVCDMERNLKVFKGTSMINMQSLLEVPTALCVCYLDRSVPRTPGLAVAGGSYIFIYRHVRPYRKWQCPSVPIAEEEAQVWSNLKSGQVTDADAYKLLDEHRQAGVKLSNRSVDLLGLPDHSRSDFINSMKNQEYVQHTLITCMESIKIDSNEVDSMTTLIVGTENKEVYILPPDPVNSMFIARVQLPAVPVLFCASGLLEVEWRIAVLCRDKKLYSIKNGDTKNSAVLSGISIDLGTQGVSVTQQDNLLWVATIDRKISCYTTRGKCQRCISVDSDVVDLSTITVNSSNQNHLLLAALVNGNIRLYKEGTCVHSFTVEKPITGIRFGQYGREDNTLCILHNRGALTIKMWKRTNKYNKLNGSAGPPPEQDIPIPIPKKTKLYVEQLQREKDQGAEIHRLFQRDLCKLRLETARAYVKVLTDVNMVRSCTFSLSLYFSFFLYSPCVSLLFSPFLR